MDWWGNVTFAVGLIAVLVGITYGIQPYGGHVMGWTSPFVLACAHRRRGCARGVRDRGTARAQPAVRPLAVLDPLVHPRQHREPARLARPRRPAVRADHLAAGHLAAPARLLLRGDAAVGRHLHAADDRRFPRRRTAVGRAVRPDGHPLVLHRRHAADGRELRAARAAARRLLLPGLRRAAAAQRRRDGPVLLAQPGRGDEQPPGPGARCGRRHERHLPELGHGAVHRPVLHADDRRPRRHPADRALDRPDQPRRPGRRRGEDRRAAAGRRALRGLPRLQPGAAAARADARHAPRAAGRAT